MSQNEFTGINAILGKLHIATIVLLLVFVTACLALLIGSIQWDTYLSFVKYAFGFLAIGRALNTGTQP